MSTRTIRSFGGCVHFKSIAGVAPRVVLPHALGVKFGTVNVTEWGGSGAKDYYAYYFAMPHFAFFRPADPKLANLGQAIVGQHIRIANTTGIRPSGTARCPGAVTPSLRAYAPGFEYSEEIVVRGSGAACIFDFDTEPTVIARRTRHDCNGASYTQILVAVPDDEDIQLEISHLPGVSFPPDLTPASIPGDDLWVGNVDYYPGAEDVQFDFMLNYLVGRD